MAIAVFTDADGEIVAKNAVEFDYSLAWLTWALQVMPLFFLAGGFSSAVSLDSHNRTGGAPQDWVANRLRRMMVPTMVLAYFWIVLLAVGSAAGMRKHGVHRRQCRRTAVVPRQLHHRHGHRSGHAAALPGTPAALFGLVVAGSFTLFEIFGIAGVPVIHNINWVIGWLIFQILGFAWKDGILPSRRTLGWLAPVLWLLTYAVVKIGPWRASMVDDGGVAFLPTHPPSIALMLFGMAYCATAVSAPRRSTHGSSDRRHRSPSLRYSAASG